MTEPTDAEKLVEFVKRVEASFGSMSMLRGDGCTDYITPSIAAEARELAARVAEWVADATIRLDERRKWVNELREENAKLRAALDAARADAGGGK